MGNQSKGEPFKNQCSGATDQHANTENEFEYIGANDGLTYRNDGGGWRQEVRETSQLCALPHSWNGVDAVR